MIIVKLMGGIGNQMFQYAIGRKLSLKNRIPLKLDISDYSKNDYLRSYMLDIFNIEAAIATTEEIESLVGKTFYSKNKIFMKLNNAYISFFKKTTIQNNKNIYREKNFHFDSNLLNISSNVYLHGYWQNENYFLDIKDFLKKDFTLKKPLSSASNILKKKIVNNVSVSLHIRRGDYLSNPKTKEVHGVCSLDYYYKGLSILQSKITEDFTCFVFSDDISWCKDNFSPDCPVVFVDINRDYEELILMSYCKHFIIANSSFSWWGAWLNDNKNKIVVSPKNWFNTISTDEYDIVPEDWIRI